MPYLKESVCDFFRGGTIKTVGNTMFLFGGTIVQSGYARDMHVYSFDMGTNQRLMEICFVGTETITRTVFEMDENIAFIGHKDGSIVIWDLNQTHKIDSRRFHEEDSKWSESDEITWNATYDKEQMDEIKKKWSYEDHYMFKKSSMEAGEFQRSVLRRRQEYHQMLQNRVWLKGHTKEITSLRAVGPFLFSASQDGTIKQWDLSTSKCIQTIETGFEEGVASFQVAGRYVFGLSRGWPRQTIRQWDFVTGKRLSQIDLKEKCHSFNIIGNLLFCLCTPSGRQVVEIYNLSTQACIKTLTAQSSWHNHMQIVDDGLYLLVEDEDHILKWDFSHSN